jgi:Ricin-type beta-trefoil lectin domain
MWPAQQAVNALRQGTVASSVTGSCLGYPRDKAGGKAELENCGSKVPQIWRLTGSTVRTTGGLCLAATSRTRSATVKLARCSRSSLQEWQAAADSALYNPGSRRCLADTVKGSGYDKPGVVLVTAPCKPTQGEGWFKP